MTVPPVTLLMMDGAWLCAWFYTAGSALSFRFGFINTDTGSRQWWRFAFCASLLLVWPILRVWVLQ
jgi:hypothetical protein